MRRSDACGYYEPREGAALSWTNFMQKTMPDATWVLLPSIGKDIIKTVESFRINAIILTGGEDIGINHIRDESETALTEYCISKNYPLLGICRGMQFLQTFFGGELSSLPSSKHVATRHNIYFNENIFKTCRKYEVNSFHNKGIKEAKLSPEFTPLAVDEIGNIEAFLSIKHRLMGMMWHPERDENPTETDILLIRKFFTNQLQAYKLSL